MAEQGTTFQRSRETAPLKPFTADFFRCAEKIHDSIARRAFEIFESHENAVGRDLDNWLKAEGEVLHPLHLDVEESDEEVTARAEVPGFGTKDLEISLEPRRLAITGRRETRQERRVGKTLYSEKCANEVFRVVDLPATVSPERASADLKEGILEITMPKTAPTRSAKPEGKAM